MPCHAMRCDATLCCVRRDTEIQLAMHRVCARGTWSSSPPRARRAKSVSRGRRREQDAGSHLEARHARPHLGAPPTQDSRAQRDPQARRACSTTRESHHLLQHDPRIKNPPFSMEHMPMKFLMYAKGRRPTLTRSSKPHARIARFGVTPIGGLAERPGHFCNGNQQPSRLILWTGIQGNPLRLPTRR